MTIQELIDYLQGIENKELPVVMNVEVSDDYLDAFYVLNKDDIEKLSEGLLITAHSDDINIGLRKKLLPDQPLPPACKEGVPENWLKTNDGLRAYHELLNGINIKELKND